MKQRDREVLCLDDFTELDVQAIVSSESPVEAANFNHEISQNNSNLHNSKPFNFDIERMKQAFASPSHVMPSNLTFNEFQSWMKSKAIITQV